VHPARAGGRLPGVVALHDHSAFKYYGKEKLVEMENEPPIMREFKDRTYAGVSWANELARRGFVVLVPDNFLWGSRKIAPESVPEEFVQKVTRETPGSRAYIEAYNEFCSEYESLVAKTLFASGTTWPGIMAWEDRRAVDYLVTRSDADPGRLGCGGLSGGGLRTIYLAALDPRIRCAVCAGFMSTVSEMIPFIVQWHTWMFHVPHLPALMDLPDVASLHGPSPLMVQGDRDDSLWTLAGQQQADEKLRKIYARMGAAECYKGLFYPGPHKFDLPMQKDAFEWFERWL
jgi:dienelactone hydrolase